MVTTCQCQYFKCGYFSLCERNIGLFLELRIPSCRMKQYKQFHLPTLQHLFFFLSPGTLILRKCQEPVPYSNRALPGHELNLEPKHAGL